MKLRLAIELNERQEQALESVIRDLRDDTKLQALGGEVTMHTALRYILYEALSDRSFRSRAPESSDLVGLGRFSANVQYPSRTEPTEVEVAEVEVAEVAEVDELSAKTYDRPTHWEYSDQGVWEFPETQAAMHAYYVAAGWLRCAAQLEDRLLEFYWTPDGSKQGLAPFDGRDSYNRMVAPQRSPDVGVAHMVPEDWDEPRGATGDIGMWSPG